MIQGICHRHLDVVVYSANNDTYPDSGLNLVRLSDQRWTLAVDFGDDFAGIAGLCHSPDTHESDIRIYSDERTALEAAFALLATTYNLTLEAVIDGYKKQYEKDENDGVYNEP